MKRGNLLLVFWIFLFGNSQLIASTVTEIKLITIPEICNNGIDDDGDGLIDCYDPDCCESSSCDPIYYDPCAFTCFEEKNQQPLDVQLEWISPNNNWHPYNTPIVADLDGDGTVEIIGNQGIWQGLIEYRNLLVLNSYDGSIEATIETPWFGHTGGEVCVGDVNLNGRAEIFFRIDDSFQNDEAIRGRMSCYAFDGTQYFEKWRSTTVVPHGIPSLSDINEDGLPELLIGRHVFNSLTGELLVSLPTGANDGNGISMAADVLPDDYCAACTHQELVVGNEVYSVSLNLINPGNNRVFIKNRVISGSGDLMDGFTAIADMDQDGDLDGIVVSTDGMNQATLYIWDIQEPIVMASQSIIATTQGYASLPGIRDIDEDGIPELVISSANTLLFFRFEDEALELMWEYPTTDWSSRSGATIFDLNGDGFFEVLHRDEKELVILDAATGQLLFSDDCLSTNLYEYPVIVDVDKDGQAEILCSCENQLRVYGAGTTPWVSTRSIWNQYAYQYTNVADDGTIPVTQQSPHISGNDFNGVLNQYSNAFEQSVLTLAFGVDTIVQVGQLVDFMPVVTSSSSIEYHWSPAENLSCDDCVQPNLTAFADQVYQLQVTNQDGCEATAEAIIQVVECGRSEIAFPNAFMPNGDGHNEVFEVFVQEGIMPDGFIAIYNRWGQRVFYGDNLTATWNGTYKGQPAISDLYVVQVGFTCEDGLEQTINGELYLIK